MDTRTTIAADDEARCGGAGRASDADITLLEALQRGLPLVPRPFAAIARACRRDETDVLATIVAERARGRIRRLGAVFAPGAFGRSVLAAIAVPDDAVERIGHRIARLPEVNHCYRREVADGDRIAYNLWFVVTAPGHRQLHNALDAIDALASHPIPDFRRPPMLRLTLRREFHCDLAFGLDGRPHPKATRPSFVGSARPVARPRRTPIDEPLVAALEDGLPIAPWPFATLAERIGADEAVVLARLRDWAEDGRMRRLAAVLDHPSVGFGANAMLVWNVPHARLEDAAAALVADPAVHLCYERERAAGWPYNLYAMVFSADPQTLAAALARVRAMPALAPFASHALVTRGRYKQTGARYGRPAPQAT